MKNESKESNDIELEGIKSTLKIGRSTNYNIDGRRMIKKTKLSDDKENKTTVEDKISEKNWKLFSLV
ncbi:hypothetical protein [Chryseobacterium polytrichastri]|uniref:hypothetical protein n=1 Tax=Chryseobacterium polytrichastri TaxID=1302687 RepID=UPI0009342B94|nr:hypothetical protein [Chryseobacterium polytrichastri]